ncbi:MAG: hypothetical protein FJW20_22295 [Acidimicrobiia bacterium]|nr:hypothetical protein [Acidimicrobiia bacterium]
MNEKQLEAIRLGKKLIAFGPELDGCPLGTLPENIYGFTFSPLNDSTPLYNKRAFQSFEVHKTAEGVQILGYATPDQARQIREGVEVEFNLYPEPRDNSTELVELSLHRIVKAKPLSRTDGNYMPVHLDAA